MSANNLVLTEDMLARYYELNKKKKEIEAEMNQLKASFHKYMDKYSGPDKKGELVEGNYKILRQVRKTEKFKEKDTVERLEQLQMDDLIQVVKKPDDAKVKAAIELGLLKEEDLESCRAVSYSQAISVKRL
ncbi:hypothetical protein [Oceanobacillus sp. J11TS1]|uniref:hypothetical protein n=1 Tax=Oceanobacillus sp. J11TS1 TaxID=2807191 RepID=UPI001B0152AC|nr:hypothetical protein [Oceanobacillus sp. J11TS1]GIO24158.1 hypothetical protein J11TS1_27390 [Oceanobacillus sp. J11TS1]